MKLSLSLFFLVFFYIDLLAQDEYRIMINGEIVVEKPVNDSIPHIRIKPQDLTRLRVAYRAQNFSETQKMRRQMMVFSPNDQELYSKQMPLNEGVVELRLNSSILSSKHTFVTLYTISFPTDPELAKRARLRRVPLATIEWTTR